MARPAIIQDSTILEAARAVFSQRGFRATTAEVAQRAGVSEGSIFKRFHSKFELFEAAMGSLDELPEIVHQLENRVGTGDVRETLLELTRGLARHLARVMPLNLLAWSNPGPDGTPACLSGPTPPPLRAQKLIAEYLEAEMELGRLAKHDPEVVARALMGAVHIHVFFGLLFNAQAEMPISEESYLSSLVELGFRGLEPRDRDAESP